jgi:hypothetical protein
VNKNEYLSEEKYQKIKKLLITLGFISLAVGIILLILAIIVKIPDNNSALADPNWWKNSEIRSDAESKKVLLF